MSGGSEQHERVNWETDPRNPFNWTLRQKWITIAVACWVTFITGLNATSIATAAEVISARFNLANDGLEVYFFAVTAWNATAAFVPLVTLPLMDTYGIRVGYLAAFALFTVFIVPQALAQNFTTLIVSRALAGAFGGTLQNVADGVVANLFFHHRERALPLTIYVLALLLGVTMGPVLGSVFEPLTWRWIFWIQLIISAVTFPLVVVFMKETRGPIVRARLFPMISEGTSHEPPMALLKETITRSAILLVAEPTITSFTLWSSFAFGLVFISTQSIPLVFSEAYGWQSYSDGLVQAAIGLGQLIGCGACICQNHVYKKSSIRNTQDPGDPIPESILHLSIPSTAVALAGGLFMYGWSVFQPYWEVTALGLVLIGYSTMVIVGAVSIYITQSYAGFAASAIAAVAFGENLFAAFLPLATKTMYRNLGYQWASSLLAFIALLLTLAPVVLLWKGRAIREGSLAIKKMAHT